MRNRRNVLKSLPMIAISCALPTSPQAEPQYTRAPIRAKAEELADALQNEHGGEWKVTIDALGEFVLVNRQFQ